MKPNDTDIVKRKQEHITAVLKGDVQALRTTTGFEKIAFSHVALPECDYAAIDLSTSFLGRQLKAPLLISSMTGGPELSGQINRSIAEAANSVGIAFGVGSQRICFEEGGGTAGFDAGLRKLAPDVPILSNIGAAQLARWKDPAETSRRAVVMIEADALIIHLNPLQEVVQEGGDKDWTGILNQIEKLAANLSVPVIVKEVGAGLSARVARQLWDAGVTIFDVAGAGGTSWAAVEAERASNPHQRAVAMAFRDWGIPTATAVVEVRKACPDAIVIASGGVRDGIDVAKAIRLGANLGGQAAALLPGAIDGPDQLREKLESVIEQLKIVCFCTASKNLTELSTAELQEPLRV